MTSIILLNPEQLVSDIALFERQSISGLLVFVKKYDQILEYLIITNLISDLRNIIMTYVNNEIEVGYIIKTPKLTSYFGTFPLVVFTINYKILFESDTFCYAQNSNEVTYINTKNNLFIMPDFGIEMSEDESFIGSMNYVLNKFTTDFHMKPYYLHRLFTTCQYIRTYDSNTCLSYNEDDYKYTITNVEMFKNVVAIMDMTFDIIRKK